MRYLDPKNDLTFKKVFGKHPNLLISFLNALLPLDNLIESVEYLPHELVPEIPVLKYSIVDVRCTDKIGRQFIVEMQMLWTNSFKSRVLFNASKAYVQQLDKGKQYKGLQPVYALSLVNEIFELQIPDFYHHYNLVHQQYPDKQLKGLELVFIELPKFKPQSIVDKKMQILWLRFLTEIEDNSEEISTDFLENPIMKEAIECLQESAFTKDELQSYDKYWDDISSEKTLISDSEDKGRLESLLQVAKTAIEKGLPNNLIKDLTGLSENEIERMRQN
jgi:predicted transposase/invertase (TIGR01784 family)